MRRIATLAASAAILGLTAAPALARDTPQNDRDMQCMMVFAALSAQMADRSQEQMGLGMGVFYYLGRLQGREPSRDWMAEIERRQDLIAPDVVAAASQRCGAEFAALGAEMQRWGNRISASGQR